MSTPTPNSSTGGYLLPEQQDNPFGNLSFEQFLQTVLVGVSGLKGEFVRPKWQLNPPKQPDAIVDWMAFGLNEDDSDTNAFVGVDSDGTNRFMRMEALSLQCSFYGPNSLEVGKTVRDGFQIPQNFAALQSVNMGFVSTSKMVRAPDVVNERWIDRWEMTVYLRREILRVYPVLNFLSGSGVLHANVSSGEKNVAIVVD